MTLADGAPAGKGGSAPAVQAALLMAVLAIEAGLFLSGTARHYAWLYPRRFDQVQYLEEAYRAYATRAPAGGLAALAASLRGTAAQGALHRPLAVLAFLALGPTRLAALSLNFWAFAALQAAFFAAVRRVWSSWPVAWMGVGLLAALAQPWSDAPGSATDFRLDWLAACGFGIALAAAWAAAGFRSTRGALAFGAAVAFVILLRYLTGAYLAVVYVGLAVAIATGPDRGPRGARLVLSGLLAAVLAGWPFWRSWPLIHDYYIVGHFTGPERGLRDSHLSGGAALGWLGGQVAADVGAVAIGLAIGGMLLLLLLRPPSRPAPAPTYPGRPAATAALFLLAPCAVLFFQPEKAPQVMSVTIPGAVGLLLAALAWCADRSHPRCRGAVGAGVVLIGLGSLGARMGAPPLTPEYEAHVRSANALADFLHYRAEEAGLALPTVAVTGVTDCLGAGVLRVQGFERHGRALPFADTLPAGLYAEPAGDVRAALERSDFVCLLEQWRQNFPIDRELAGLVAPNRRWCQEHLHFDGEVRTALVTVAVYESPRLDRPAGGVELAAMVRAALEASDPAKAVPPGPGRMRPLQPVLWAESVPVDFQLPGVYSPLAYRAEALPAGVALDPATGRLSGRFPRAGRYAVSVVASNARGGSRGEVEFTVGHEPFAAAVDLVPRARGDVSFAVDYRAFAAAGTLNFIDVTDLTAVRVLARIPAGPDQARSWQGRFIGPLADARTHQVQFRFVCYDPAAKAYTFIDRLVAVAAGAAPPQAAAAAATNWAARAVMAAQSRALSAAAGTSEEPAAVAKAPARRKSPTVSGVTPPVGTSSMLGKGPFSDRM